MLFLSCHKDDWRLKRDWVYYLTGWFKSQFREKTTGRTELKKWHKQEESTTLFTRTGPFCLKQADRIRNNSNIIRESQYGCTSASAVCNPGVWIRGFLWVSVNYSVCNSLFFLFLTESHTGVFTTDISLTCVFGLLFSHGLIMNKCTCMLTAAGTCVELQCELWIVCRQRHSQKCFGEQSASRLPLQPLCLQSEAWLSPTDLNFGLLLFCCNQHSTKKAVYICIRRIWQYNIKDTVVELFLVLWVIILGWAALTTSK